MAEPYESVIVIADSHRYFRCGVCGVNWLPTDLDEGEEDTPENRRRRAGHPPLALWNIKPLGWKPMPLDWKEDDQKYPCFASMTPIEIGTWGQTLTACAVRIPEVVPEQTLVVAANTPGFDPSRRKTLARYPDEVCPPAHKRGVSSNGVHS